MQAATDYAPPPNRHGIATAWRQALVLLAVSAVLAGGRWALDGNRLPLRAEAAHYELELAAPLVDVATARELYDQGIHLFVDTRSSGVDIKDTVPGAFVIRPESFDDDMRALRDILVMDDQFILFGDGNLVLANNVAARLIQRGYPQVAILKGGLDAWRHADGPLSVRREPEAP